MSSKTQPRVEHWKGPGSATESQARSQLAEEGYQSFIWKDRPGTSYSEHLHECDECIWVLAGEIVFHAAGTDLTLRDGDRLYLPAGTRHTAKVPSAGSVTYLVGQRDAR